MPKALVRIQVIKVYELEVESDESGDEFFVEAAYDLQSTKIEAEGKLIDVSTDHAEVIED